MIVNIKKTNFFFFDKLYMRHETNRIRSKYHNMGASRINNVFLNCYYDKNYKHKHGYSTLFPFCKSTR